MQRFQNHKYYKMINKIYICSTNLSGKGYLLSLLDGHVSNEIYPYHKFGFSDDLNKFIRYLSKERYPVDIELLQY